MSRVKVRYFVEKPQKGGHSLFYWQPSAALVRAGFTTRRLAEGSNDRGEALKQAEALNRELDAWRGGKDVIPSRDGTIPWLISRYVDDELFTKLTPGTQRHYRYDMNKIEAWSARAGHPPIKSITRKIAKKLSEHDDEGRSAGRRGRNQNVPDPLALRDGRGRRREQPVRQHAHQGQPAAAAGLEGSGDRRVRPPQKPPTRRSRSTTHNTAIT